VRYGYYPGCSLKSSATEYDASLRAVFEQLGVELVEVPDWVCCGAAPAATVDRRLVDVLSGYNLALAAQVAPELIVPCPECYKNLRHARKSLQEDEGLVHEVEAAFGGKLPALPEVKHPLEVLLQMELPQVGANSRSPLQVACYHGCLLTRPTPSFDSSEFPTAMDRILGQMGYETVDFHYKAKCCGGALLLPHEDTAVELTARVLKSARDAGANCVAVACPLCHMMLDAYQSRAEQKLGQELNLPVVYFTQLMGAAMGIDPALLGFERLVVSPKAVLEVIG